MKRSLLLFILIITLMSSLTGKYFTLESSHPEEDLIRPGKILEGPDGNIYIYDSQDAFIKVFSPRGGFIRKMGGKGEGPGQVKRADGLDFGFTPDGKQIHFTEFFRGHRWITFLDLNGKLNRTLTYGFTGNFGILRSVIVRNNLIFIQRQKPGKEIRRNDIHYGGYVSELIVLNGNGEITATVLTRANPETMSFIRDGGDTGIPFSPRFLWAVTGQGNILFTDGTGPDLELLDREGKRLNKITVPGVKPMPVTEKDLTMWRTDRKEMFSHKNRAWYNEFGSVIEKYTKSIFKYKPVILDLSLTPGNNILLKCLTDKKDTFKYLLIDNQGHLISALNSGFSDIRLSDNYIFLRTINDEDEISILFLKRKGGEKEDLFSVKNNTI